MTDHAVLSASGTHKWMTCPGSIHLEKDQPDNDSEHARLGSAAHALGEHCLLTGDLPLEYLNEPVPADDYADMTVDTDMVQAVEVYVDHVRSLDVVPTEGTVERRVSLEKLGDWATGMFGTGDLIALSNGCLDVCDYKHGQGVVVEVADNTQFKYYAVGALLELDDDDLASVTEVNTTVIQPRAYHEDGPVRHQSYTPVQLMDWAEGELRSAVEEVDSAGLDMGKPGWAERYLNPSEKGCKFCKAKAVCPALAAQRLEEAMLEFGDNGRVQPLIALDKLTPQQVAGILANEKAIKDWLSGVADLAKRGLEQGNDITGGHYKLVAGRSSRKWKSEDVAETCLVNMGVDIEEMYVRKILTPAQAEKLVSKDQKKELAALVVKEEGKPTMVPAEDKRPAYNMGPEADFTA